MPTKTDLTVNEVLAIVGEKIAETDLDLKEFPTDTYTKGARDMAVNILQAIRDAAGAANG